MAVMSLWCAHRINERLGKCLREFRACHIFLAEVDISRTHTLTPKHTHVQRAGESMRGKRQRGLRKQRTRKDKRQMEAT